MEDVGTSTVGNAVSRALMFDARGEEDVAFYPSSAWTNMLFGGGYTFERPIPEVTPEGIEPYPPTGARKHDLRTLFFYGYTGITPAMAMRLTGLGSQYLVAFFDSKGEYFDGAKSYTVTLPPNPPEARFWSFTLYDNQTRSMLATPQRFPRVEASPTRRPLRCRATTVPSPSTSRPSSPTAWPTATGSRRCRARASSPCCGSTARSSRSSTRPGRSARSNPSPETFGSLFELRYSGTGGSPWRRMGPGCELGNGRALRRAVGQGGDVFAVAA